jgi:hypothetical protein
VWLIFVWHEKADEPGNERWLLCIGYVIGLATGVHLLMILAIPALALVMYFRRREFELKSFRRADYRHRRCLCHGLPGRREMAARDGGKFESLFSLRLSCHCRTGRDFLVGRQESVTASSAPRWPDCC